MVQGGSVPRRQSMRLIDFFDRGAALYPERACMTDERRSLIVPGGAAR